MNDFQQVWDAEGRISLTTLITDLMRIDLSIFESNSFPFDESILKSVFWYTAKQSASRGVDIPVSSNLPSGLGSKSRMKLLHERYHFAQLITYPMTQMNFLNEMEMLRARVAESEGYPHLLCGQAWAHQLASIEHMQRELELTAAYFSGTVHVSNAGIRVPGADNLELLPAIFEYAGRQFKGAAARIYFGKDCQTVAFTVINLLESAAVAAEYLYEGKKLPRLTQDSSQRELRYFGCWEVWCRIHAHRFDTMTEATEAFLVTIDLALGGHGLVEHDHAFREQAKDHAFSINARQPYARFWALLLNADKVKIPKGLKDTARAMYFQSEFCKLMKWPDPKRTYQVMAAFLTQRLLSSSFWCFESNVSNKELMRWVLETDFSIIADNLEKLEPIWEAITQSLTETLSAGSTNTVFGSRIVARMISSCLIRVSGNFILAAPHTDKGALANHYNLPIIRIGNQYFGDFDLSGSEDMNPELGTFFNSPMRVAPADIMTDCIAIAALRPLADGNKRCGLIDSVTGEPNCIYTAAGAGCPQIGLTGAQNHQREVTGVYDWCHWTHAAIRIGVAPENLTERWIERWQTNRE